MTEEHPAVDDSGVYPFIHAIGRLRPHRSPMTNPIYIAPKPVHFGSQLSILATYNLNCSFIYL
jgi:hypothetical protein